MSYLSHPQLFFSGKFHADPATINNTPDNYNPDTHFPPDDGAPVSNNIQLYWNPNGSGKFALDCTVTKVCDANGNAVPDSALLGTPLRSRGGLKLAGGKLVDLDPMQQNVTELWGLALELDLAGSEPQIVPLGEFVPSAYSNAWIQVVGGHGDYAGSAQYQSVLVLDPETVNNSPQLQQLLGHDEGARLSIAFVLRAYNSSSFNYLVNEQIRNKMNKAGVPSTVTDKLKPIQLYSQGAVGKPKNTPGQIPTTSYFEKLVNYYISSDESAQYLTQIKQAALLPYTAATPFDFTWGQVFGVIGRYVEGEPAFFTPDRMLTPTGTVVNDTQTFPAYFAPFTLSSTGDLVTINLGNALLSTQPASAQNSYVDQASMGQLQLCYFNGAINVANAVMLGEIAYQDNQFYLNDAALAQIPITQEAQAAVKNQPLGIISTVSTTVGGVTASVQQILLQENSEGYYLRANQFVFRINPGMATTPKQPRGSTQTVEIYVSRFGQPVANAEIGIKLMSAEDSATYTNNTLGTGGSSGLTNMGVPTWALNFPAVVSTDAQGIARFTVSATDPGNPRGFVDGQIYFLQYGFTDAAISANYTGSPDNIISIQVYSQQPLIEGITWDNFVKKTLGLYGKLYPVMGFLDLENMDSVIANAENIYNYLNKDFAEPGLMPVTRDLSASRLALLNAWLQQYFTPPSKKSAFPANKK